jgi:hypothetical protein
MESVFRGQDQYSVVPPDWSLTVMDFVPPVPPGTHRKCASVALVETVLMLAQSVTVNSKLLGKLLPVTWK